MSINVNFRVVGNFFGSDKSVTGPITVEVDDNPTVAQIMNTVAAKANQPGDGIPGVESFSFSPLQPTPEEFLASIFVSYKDAPKEGLPKGNYFLSQDLSSNPQAVWQYYIFDKNFVQVNRSNTFQPFGGPPEVPIEEGYTVIWRRVSILTGPTDSRFLEGLKKRILASYRD